MNSIGPVFISVVGGIIGLAIVAVLVSRNAQTPAVMQGIGDALSKVIGAAVAPVTSNSTSFGSSGLNTLGH
jgi:hypothetical protein